MKRIYRKINILFKQYYIADNRSSEIYINSDNKIMIRTAIGYNIIQISYKDNMNIFNTAKYIKGQKT